MSDDAIGISVGTGSEAGLGAFLENNGSETGTVFALGYDFSFYMQQLVGARLAQAGPDVAGGGADALEFYSSLIERQYNEVRLTSQGVEASQVITFK